MKSNVNVVKTVLVVLVALGIPSCEFWKDADVSGKPLIVDGLQVCTPPRPTDFGPTILQSQCNADPDCPSGAYCDSGSCVFDCSPGLLCSAGQSHHFAPMETPRA